MKSGREGDHLMIRQILQHLRTGRLSWLSQLIKYGLVGVLNTLITLCVIFLLRNVFKYPYVIANGTGYILGFINSFILNKIWTFRSKRKLLREISGFIIVFAICYALQLGAASLMIKKMHVFEEIATIVAMILYTGLNFIGNKWIAFRKG
jgi:putative flippase GtrA